MQSRLSMGILRVGSVAVSLALLTSASVVSAASAPAPPAADETEPTAASAPDAGDKEIRVTTAMLSPRRNNSLSPRRFVPVLGDGTPLEGARFYLEIDRPDLAAEYKKRQRIRWALYGTGAALYVGGLSVALVGVLGDPKNRKMQIGGAITGTVGLLTIAGGGWYNHFNPSHPIEPAVAKDLIDQHNAALQRGPTARVGVAPLVSGTTAGLRVSGRF